VKILPLFRRIAFVIAQKLHREHMYWSYCHPLNYDRRIGWKLLRAIAFIGNK